MWRTSAWQTTSLKRCIDRTWFSYRGIIWNYEEAAKSLQIDEWATRQSFHSEVSRLCLQRCRLQPQKLTELMFRPRRTRPALTCFNNFRNCLRYNFVFNGLSLLTHTDTQRFVTNISNHARAMHVLVPRVPSMEIGLFESFWFCWAPRYFLCSVRFHGSCDVLCASFVRGALYSYSKCCWPKIDDS